MTLEQAQLTAARNGLREICGAIRATGGAQQSALAAQVYQIALRTLIACQPEGERLERYP
jgi:hypothetical protein